MFRKLLDLICPRIPPGHQVPYGFSIGRDLGGYKTDVVRFCLPLCYWRGQDYLPDIDMIRHGWWLQMGIIRVMRVPGGFQVQFLTGAFRRGNGKLKECGTDSWLDEDSWHHGLRAVIK